MAHISSPGIGATTYNPETVARSLSTSAQANFDALLGLSFAVGDDYVVTSSDPAEIEIVNSAAGAGPDIFRIRPATVMAEASLPGAPSLSHSYSNSSIPRARCSTTH